MNRWASFHTIRHVLTDLNPYLDVQMSEPTEQANVVVKVSWSMIKGHYLVSYMPKIMSWVATEVIPINDPDRQEMVGDIFTNRELGKLLLVLINEINTKAVSFLMLIRQDFPEISEELREFLERVPNKQNTTMYDVLGSVGWPGGNLDDELRNLFHEANKWDAKLADVL